MAGCFSLCEDHAHDYHVPPERLVESHPCADVFALYREGLLLQGASATLQLQWGHRGSSWPRETPEFGSTGNPIAVRSHTHLPLPVFICPACNRDRYRLYEVGGVWACRTCHRLDYACRHKQRSIPGLNRALYLRRKIGAPPVPFWPIAPKPRYARRYWRIVAEIRRLEASLVRHARRDVCDVLERRHDRSRGHGAGNR